MFVDGPGLQVITSRLPRIVVGLVYQHLHDLAVQADPYVGMVEYGGLGSITSFGIFHLLHLAPNVINPSDGLGAHPSLVYGIGSLTLKMRFREEEYVVELVYPVSCFFFLNLHSWRTAHILCNNIFLLELK